VTLDGYLNLLKPPGMTSHDVVAWARSQLGIARIGHLGTLDPAAAGVLPLSLGRATRLFDYAAGPDKAYRAEIVFGVQTDTLDAEGAVVARSDASALTEGALRALLPRFMGEIEQIPPAFSSVSVGGRRLHESARAGTRLVGGPRRVKIKQLDLVDFSPGNRAHALIDIVCTSGTYIRALADDLGRAAGCGACLGFLVRTRAGRFELADSNALEEVAELLSSAGADDLLLPLDWPLVGLPEVVLSASEALAFVRGTRVRPQSAEGGLRTEARRVRAYGPGALFLGLGEVADEGLLQPRVVLRSEQELPT
jgi:tRNA pseudouridine55 synthase